jgi:hypothetical protein
MFNSLLNILGLSESNMYDRVKLQNLMVTTKAYLVPHGNRTLSDHLLRCYDLAVHSGLSMDVCYACAAHSLYGTDTFKTTVTEDRKLVQDVIGVRAEQLAYLFSRAQRTKDWHLSGVYIDRFSKSEVRLDPTMLLQLTQIEHINLIEQNSAPKQVQPVAQNVQTQVQTQTGIATTLSNQPNKARNSTAIPGSRPCCGRGGY